MTDDTVTLGKGADTYTYAGGADTVTGGAGVDTYDVNALGTKAEHLVITDLATGDKIDLVGAATGTIANVTLGDAVTLGAGSTESLDNYLAAASAGDGGTNSVLTHFQFGGNTYLVVDKGAGASFTDGTDGFIELTGLVTLKGSSTASEILTLA